MLGSFVCFRVLTSSRPASSSCFPSLAAWRIGDGSGVWWSEEKKKKSKTIVSMVFEKNSGDRKASHRICLSGGNRVTVISFHTLLVFMFLPTF